jgi:dihydroneopterin aldolase
MDFLRAVQYVTDKLTTPISLLEVLAYRIPVSLGCTAQERAEPQDVDFDVRIQFKQSVAGAWSDRLEDTLCYSSLCGRIEAIARARPYHLVESLARDVFEALRALVPESQARLQVRVHKLRPPVERLNGGARFTYGDPLA